MGSTHSLLASLPTRFTAYSHCCLVELLPTRPDTCTEICSSSQSWSTVQSTKERLQARIATCHWANTVRFADHTILRLAEATTFTKLEPDPNPVTWSSFSQLRGMLDWIDLLAYLPGYPTRLAARKTITNTRAYGTEQPSMALRKIPTRLAISDLTST